MRLQGEHQTIGSFEFVDVQCEDDCSLKCYEGEMPGIFSIDAFGKMDLRLHYTSTGFCLNLLGAKQANRQLGGFRMRGYLHESLSTRKPSIGGENRVTFDDCVMTNLLLMPIGSTNEITIGVHCAIEDEHISGDITFSQFTVGIEGLLQWLGVRAIDVDPCFDMRRTIGGGSWKMEHKLSEPIRHQLEDARIEFVPTTVLPGWSGWSEAIPEKYTVRQGMLIRFIYSEDVPLKTLMESMLEFQDFLAFALNLPVMVRSSEGFYRKVDSTPAFRRVYFPSHQQPEIDTMGIHRGDFNSLFVYDQIDDFASTFAAWRKLRSEVSDPFFGSVVDMYLKCLSGSRFAQDLLVDYQKIIELTLRQFAEMDESELRQWNWDLGPFPQERDLMVEPYWDNFFLPSLEESGYASTPKEFGKTARKLRNAIVHPVDAAENLEKIGIEKGDKRALSEHIIRYAMMYERLVQLYLVTFLGLDPIKLADDGNLFASRVLGPSLTIRDIRVN